MFYLNSKGHKLRQIILFLGFFITLFVFSIFGRIARASCPIFFLDYLFFVFGVILNLILSTFDIFLGRNFLIFLIKGRIHIHCILSANHWCFDHAMWLSLYLRLYSSCAIISCMLFGLFLTNKINFYSPCSWMRRLGCS